MRTKIKLREIPEEDFLVGRLDLRTVSANENSDLFDYLTEYQKAIVKAVDIDGKELRKTRRMVRNLSEGEVDGRESEDLQARYEDLRTRHVQSRKQASQDRDSVLKASEEVRDWLINEAKQEFRNKTRFVSYHDESRVAAMRDRAVRVKLANDDYREAATEARKVFAEKVAALDREYTEQKAALRKQILEEGKALRDRVVQYRTKMREERKSFKRVRYRLKPEKVKMERDKTDPRCVDDLKSNTVAWKYRSFIGKKQREYDKLIYDDRRRTFSVKDAYLDVYLREDFVLLDEQTFRWWNKQRLKRGNPLFTSTYALVDCMAESEQGCRGEPVTPQWERMCKKRRRIGVGYMLEFLGYSPKALGSPDTDVFEEFNNIKLSEGDLAYYLENLPDVLGEAEHGVENLVRQIESEVRVRTGAYLNADRLKEIKEIVDKLNIQKLAEDTI